MSGIISHYVYTTEEKYFFFCLVLHHNLDFDPWAIYILYIELWSNWLCNSRYSRDIREKLNNTGKIILSQLALIVSDAALEMSKCTVCLK